MLSEQMEVPQRFLPTHLQVEVVVVDICNTFVNNNAWDRVPIPGGMLGVRGPETDVVSFSADNDSKRGLVWCFGRDLSKCGLQPRKLYREDMRVLSLVACA